SRSDHQIQGTCCPRLITVFARITQSSFRKLPPHPPQHLIQRLEQTKPLPQIITYPPSEEPAIQRTLADEVDILAAMPLKQIIRQDRIERALVALPLQSKGVLSAESSHNLPEFGRFAFNETPQAIHGFF